MNVSALREHRISFPFRSCNLVKVLDILLFFGGERGRGGKNSENRQIKDSALIGKFERKENYRGRKVTARRQTAGKTRFARKEKWL